MSDLDTRIASIESIRAVIGDGAAAAAIAALRGHSVRPSRASMRARAKLAGGA